MIYGPYLTYPMTYLYIFFVHLHVVEFPSYCVSVYVFVVRGALTIALLTQQR